jgi:hypothetical protein
MKKVFIATLLAQLASTIAGVLPVSEAYASCKQPVYIIAHRCNDADDPADAVAAHGINAIEADFSWHNGWYAEHDFVIPTSTTLQDWLTAVAAEVTRPGTPLSLILLDIKDPDGDLVALYNAIRGGLGPNINLIFSFDNWSKRHNFDDIDHLINADPRAGVAIDYLDEMDPEQTQANVQAFFMGLGITKYWFADGYNVTAVTPDSVKTNVAAGEVFRDSESDCSAFHGVYTWTYEDDETIRYFLDGGVNGIFMNTDECHAVWGFPDWTMSDAVAYAKTLPGRKFATPSDNPFDLSPEITCAIDTTAQCSAFGGTSADDKQLENFFGGVTCSSQYCDPVVSNDAPSFFGVGTTTEVTFTATLDTNCSPSSTCTAKVTVQDNASPLISCPADIAQDPVSQDGNVVTFNITATDTCDGNAQVVCDHPSGSTFAMGPPTTVTCTATDASKNKVACSFNVKIYTPQEVVANLKAAAAGLSGSLNQGQSNSVMSLLDALLESIDAHNTAATCGELQGFITKMTKWVSSGILTSAEGQPLIDSANNLRKTFGC